MLEQYAEQDCDCTELLDLLFDQDEGILCHEGKAQPNTLSWDTGDFLSTLLGAADSDLSLGSPYASDSGMSEDTPSPPLPVQPPHNLHLQTAVSDAPSVYGHTLNPGCGDAGQQQRSTLSLTVKDLLLSLCVSEPVPTAQQPELQLNEEERRLLDKEGITMPTQLPLTKYEERILKKIRRKIRNRQSAQESRRKRREYTDGLENRMAACSAENQALQRKVSHLEQRNMSLLQQLGWLQALVMSSTNRTAQTSTCLLVLLLSFSLLLLPSLSPFTKSHSQHGDYSPVRVQSRSLLHSSHVLQPQQQERELIPPSLPPPLPPSLPPSVWVEEMEHDSARMGKLHTDSPHLNSSHRLHAHHHGDPITGHIATVTFSPRGGSQPPPHTDHM